VALTDISRKVLRKRGVKEENIGRRDLISVSKKLSRIFDSLGFKIRVGGNRRRVVLIPLKWVGGGFMVMCSNCGKKDTLIFRDTPLWSTVRCPSCGELGTLCEYTEEKPLEDREASPKTDSEMGSGEEADSTRLVGLTRNEKRIYEHIRTLGSATQGDLHQTLRLEYDEIQDAVSRLMERDLIECDPAIKTYQPIRYRIKEEKKHPVNREGEIFGGGCGNE